MLINALRDERGSSRKLLPSVRRSPAIADFATRRIFEALYAMEDAGAVFPFAELEGRLEQADQRPAAQNCVHRYGRQEPEACLRWRRIRCAQSKPRDAKRAARNSALASEKRNVLVRWRKLCASLGSWMRWIENRMLPRGKHSSAIRVCARADATVQTRWCALAIAYQDARAPHRETRNPWRVAVAVGRCCTMPRIHRLVVN